MFYLRYINGGPPAMEETQEMRVQSLHWEDPLGRKWQSTLVFFPFFSYPPSPHSGILASKIPWTEELGGLFSPWGRTESDTTEQLSIHNGNIQ